MPGALAGKRILIVEDEYLIAADLKRTLAREEAIVLGPVGTLEGGLALAIDPIDAAVLDVNLEGAFSYGIADALDARSVPYAFLTGYDEWSLPEAYRDTPKVTKPFTAGAIVAMVESLVAAREAA